MKQKKKQIVIISCIILVLVLSLGFAAWFMHRPGRPVIVTESKSEAEWYDPTGTEFTITTAEELFEFAELSSKYDFEGQTIKLGADIVVNEGNAEDWATEMPEHIWYQPIDNFAGTFDGQGHTISGIFNLGYLYKVNAVKLTPLPAGLFSNTKEDCVIKNFKLVNSYFLGDLQNGAGTISACGGGTFESIYSNATLVSYKYYNGGIIGMASESTTIRNCWYDGKMEIIGGYARYTGGLIGRSVNFDDSTFTIEHCLVTATMDNETTKCGVGMGALVGNVRNDSTVTVDDCFVASKLTNEWGAAVGSVYGVSEERGTVNMTNTYALDDGYKKLVGAILGTANGMPVGYPRELVTGNGGYQWTTLDFDNYWSVVEDGTPILKTFADVTPSLEGVERYVDTSWYTNEATEYVLKDKADLYGFSILSQSWNFEGKTVKLGADIVVNSGKASSFAKQAPALEWISISPKSKPFAGTFDGKMHTISGLYMDTDAANSGLFSATGETSIIKNLKLKNSYFKSEATDLGSIAGQGRGAFDTVYSDAIVVASKARSGGLIGMAYGTKVSMKNCWFAGTVTNSSNDKTHRGTGGLIGVVYDGGSAKLQSCLNTGTIDVRSYTINQNKTGNPNVAPIAGGLVGWVKTKDSTISIQDSLNTGKVLVNAKATNGYGSIIGLSDSAAKISHTYASTESSANTVKGSMDGWALAFETAKLTGHEGYVWTTLNFDKYWAVAEKGTPVLKSFAGKGVSTNGVARMVDTSWYDESKDTYTLNDVADLYGLAYLANGTDFAKKTILLGADIAVNNGNAADWANAAPANVWMSISPKNKPFAGTFDGQMHTISGIYVNTDVANSGLFCATGETSVIKNLKLTNSYITSTSTDVGSIAGQGRGTFDTVYSDAIVVASKARVGGFIGMAYGTDVVMRNCWFAGTVTNTSNDKGHRGTGGLIGVVYDSGSAKLEGCLNTGIVDVSAYTFDQNTDPKKTNIAPIAGGLVGYVKTGKSKIAIENCLNTGTVKASDVATGAYGAIIGLTENKAETAVATTYTTFAPVSGSSVTGKIVQVSVDELVGYNSYQRTRLDFDKYWTVVIDDATTADIDEKGAPILKSFASVVPDLSKVELLMDFSWIDADGTEEDPYIISDMKDLNGLAALAADSAYNGFAGKYIKLGADIVVNKGYATGWGKEAPTYSWTPIGSKDIPFAGTFDGDMHSISGLYVKTTAQYAGLFGYVKTGTIKNLKLVNSYFETSAADCGSIAGYAKGNFDTVYSDAIVISSNARVGGFIGIGDGAVTMNQCWFAGLVKNTGANTTRTGGFIGNHYSGTVTMTNCLNTGTVDVSAYTKSNYPLAGGFVGQVGYNKINPGVTVTIEDCLNAGRRLIASDKTSYGAFTGYMYHNTDFTITTSYSDSSKCGSMGYYSFGEGTTINDLADKTSASEVINKAFVKHEDAIDSKLVGFDFKDVWTAVTGGTPVLTKFKEEAVAPIVPDTSWLQEGDGSEARPYVISDRNDLYGLANLVNAGNNFAGKIIELSADIEINKGNAKDWDAFAPEYDWTPIGSSKTNVFAGIFDGKKHTISGICLNTANAYTGLFGVIQTKGTTPASVKNLKLSNSYFKSTAADCGSIAGLATGNFDSVYSDAIVVCSNARVGGFFGMGNTSVSMNQCWFAGTVTNTSTNTRTGGFIGNMYAGTLTMTNCLNSGTVDVSAYTTNNYPLAGGFVGQVGVKNNNPGVTVTIENCLNTGTKVTASDSTSYGAFTGYMYHNTDFTITTSYSDKSKCNSMGYYSFNEGTKINELTDKTAASALLSQAFVNPEDMLDAKLVGFNFDTVWKAVPEKTPILKSFEK